MIWLGIMASMYSIFLPFYQNLWDLTDYNIAYYGATAAVERWLLITKYQDPGFEGSGWWINHTNYWPPSDAEFNNFSRFNYDQNGIVREIKSRTKQIPNTGQWNVPYLLASTDSSNYNVLNYQDTETFIMTTDNTSDVTKYYDKDASSNITAFTWTEAIWTIRLPPKIYSWFGGDPNALLCDSDIYAYCDSNQDTIYNETAITRWVAWIYDPGGLAMKFKIIPTTAIFFNMTPSMIDLLHDNNFREDAINYTNYTAGYPTNINFSNLNYFNPILRNTPYLLDKHNVVAESGAILNTKTFTDIFQSSYANISMSINHLLMSQGQDIYPFLEYKFTFDQEISDRFFHINGQGKVGNYDISIIVNKPSIDQSTVGDFTIIF